MPTFLYQGYSAEGRNRKGRLEALDAKEARERLLKDGIYPREVSLAGAGRGRRFTLSHRAVLYRELGVLLRAGLPLDRCLGLLGENPSLAPGAEALSATRDRVREGGDLSEALRAQLPAMRDDEVAVLAAGESAGRLSEVSLELAHLLEEENAVREQVRSALVYPLLVLVLALLVLGGLVGFLLPVYERLLGGLSQELPWITRKVLAAGRAIRHPLGLGLLAGLVLMAIQLLRGLRKQANGPAARARFRLPVLGVGLAALARARFARTLALLLDGGVPVQNALRIAGRATGSLWIAEACFLAADRVAQGERVASALSEVPVLREELPGWAQAGESSGELAPLLRHAAQSQQRVWDRSLRLALSLLEPALIVGLGLLILVVALAVLLPMLRLNQGLAR